MKRIEYKIDVMKALKEIGYTSTRLRKEKLFGEADMQKMRHSQLVSWKNMTMICTLLNCDISDIIHCVDAEE